MPESAMWMLAWFSSSCEGNAGEPDEPPREAGCTAVYTWYSVEGEVLETTTDTWDDEGRPASNSVVDASGLVYEDIWVWDEEDCLVTESNFYRFGLYMSYLDVRTSECDGNGLPLTSRVTHTETSSRSDEVTTTDSTSTYAYETAHGLPTLETESWVGDDGEAKLYRRARDWVDGREVAKDTWVDARLYQHETWDWDEDGNPLSYTGTVEGGWFYEYDDSGRLIGETATYDAEGTETVSITSWEWSDAFDHPSTTMYDADGDGAGDGDYSASIDCTTDFPWACTGTYAHWERDDADFAPWGVEEEQWNCGG